MNISAVQVATNPDKQLLVKDKIDAFAWSEVHHCSNDGRMIITIEGETTEEDLERLKTIKQLPDVLSAGMVQYCFEDEMQEMWDSTHNSPTIIPEYLDKEDAEYRGNGIYRAMKGISDY